MKQILKKGIIFAMTGIMLLGSVAPTFATVNEKQTVNVNNNAQTEVIYNQESTFGVKVPKLISLDSDKTSSYTVEVFGDISSDETIYAIPDNSFLMKDTNTSNPKDDVEALVNQSKTEWKFNELETIGNGNVTAENLTAGTWEGKFYFNIKLENCNISVTAKNEAGEDLNASASLITGNEKDNLLNSLVEEGFVSSKEDVDALINVKSDDFDGLADTTFDVSDTFEEGDEIIILHFNEETSEWEYIGQETVDENGLISGNFTSYSPVAFVKINETGEYVPVTLEAGLYDANGNLLCSWEESGIDVEKSYGTSSNCTKSKTSPYYIITNKYPSTRQIILPNTVTKLGTYIFAGCKNIRSIEISETINTINNFIFYGCNNLTHITVSSKNQKYDSRENCNAIIETNTNILVAGCDNTIIPNTIVEIGECAFAWRNLTTINIPSSVTTIGSSAFSYSNIKEINIPSSVIRIENYAFFSCGNLTSVIFEDPHNWYRTLNNSTTTIDSSVLANPTTAANQVQATVVFTKGEP